MKFELPDHKKFVHQMVIPIRWGDMDAFGPGRGAGSRCSHGRAVYAPPAGPGCRVRPAAATPGPR